MSFELIRVMGSGSQFMGVAIYGKHSGKRWHTLLIKTPFKVLEASLRMIRRLQYSYLPSMKHHIIDTGLKPFPHDADVLMLHGMFALLVRHVNRYGGIEEFRKTLATYKDTSNKKNGGFFYKEIVELYDWWTKGRPEAVAEIKALNERAYKDMTMGMNGKVFEFSGVDRELSGKATALRNLLDEQDEANLHRLVSIRTALNY